MNDEEYGPPIWITLARIYDVLTVIAMAVDQPTTMEVIEAHGAGRLWGPMPRILMEENSGIQHDEQEVHMEDTEPA